MKKSIRMFGIVMLIVVLVILIMVIQIGQIDTECVGYTVKDYSIDPIVVDDELYFSVPEYFNDEEQNGNSTFELYGYIGSEDLYNSQGKINNLLAYLDYLLADPIYVDTRYNEQEYMKLYGVYFNKIQFLEQNERVRQILDTYSSYIMISSNDSGKGNYLFPKELILELEQEFGECSYDVNDFKEMKEVYYVFVNPYSHYEEGSLGNRHYVATIFMDENNKFYYCNSNNLINDELSRMIKEILKNGEVVVSY